MQSTYAEMYKTVGVTPTPLFLSYLKGEAPITKEMVKAALDKRFLGKEFAAYHTPHKVGPLILAIIRNHPKYRHLSEFFTYDNKPTQHIVIYYRKRWLFDVDIKKRKGKYHNSIWGGGYYDWEVAGFEVDMFDLDKAIESIDRQRREAEDKSRRDLLEAAQAIKALKSLFPNDPDYKIRWRAEYLDKHYYEALSELKKQEG